jgi:hypothetical protein
MLTPDIGAIAAALVLATMGIVVSIWPPQTHRPLWFIAFAAVGIFGAFEVWLQDANQEQEVAESKSDEAFKIAVLERKLTRALSDIRTVQQLNMDLQKQLLESNKAVVALAKESNDEITGGESFCYVDAGQFALTEGLGVFLLGKGKNPVSDVNIRIVDLDEAFRSGQYNRAAERVFSFPHPTRYAGSLKILYFIKVDSTVVYKRLNVFMSTRNAIIHGLIRLRRSEDGKSWRRANRVDVGFFDKARKSLTFDDQSGFSYGHS